MTSRHQAKRTSSYRWINPFSPWLPLYRHGRLIFDLTRRDVSGRYRGSAGGTLWAFINPLLMLAIYSFVFGHIFKARWATAEMGEVKYPIVLFVGLIFSNFLSECLTRAPTLVVSNTNYVTKVMFPLEVLPWVAAGTALFHAAISVLVLLLAMLATGVPIAPSAVLLPLLFLLFLPMVTGLMWFLAAMGVFLRDLQQVMAVTATALMFLAPVFYPRTMLNEEYRWLMSLNPLTFMVEAGRDLALWNRLPDLWVAGGYALVSLAVAWLGWSVFQFTRRGFADVL